jgi:hypothetical protein
MRAIKRTLIVVLLSTVVVAVYAVLWMIPGLVRASNIQSAFGFQLPVSNVTANSYPVAPTDSIILAAQPSGAGFAQSINLPAATGSGKVYIIIHTTSRGCNIVPSGTDNINASNSSMTCGTAPVFNQLTDYQSGQWITSVPLSGNTNGIVVWDSANRRLINSNLLYTQIVQAGGNNTFSGYNFFSSPFSSTQATAPTLTAGCNGAGSSVAAGSTDITGTFTTQTGAATTCTLTFNVGFSAAPTCLFTDGNASVTPISYSSGAVTGSTAVVDFASASNRVVQYLCIGH